MVKLQWLVVCPHDVVDQVDRVPAVLVGGMAPPEVFMGWLWWLCHVIQLRCQAEAEDEHQCPPRLHPAVHKAGSQHFHKGRSCWLGRLSYSVRLLLISSLLQSSWKGLSFELLGDPVAFFLSKIQPVKDAHLGGQFSPLEAHSCKCQAGCCCMRA